MKNKLKKIFTCQITYYLLSALLIIVLYFSNLTLKMKSLEIADNKYKIAFLMVGILIIIVIIGIIHILNKKRKSNLEMHKVFLILSSVLGIFYLLLSPLFTGSDEHNHYYRIYEITSGTLTTPVSNVIGSKLPSSLYKTFINNDEKTVNRNINIKYDDIRKMSSIPLKQDEKEQYGIGYEKEYSNTALYSPIQYLPQVVGMGIGRIFNLSPYYLGMIARLFNLLFYLILGTIAFKLLPRFKTFALILMTSPTILSNATTLSADAFTNVLVFLFISFILYCIENKKKFNKMLKLFIIVLSIMMASCKIVYLPYIFLLFLIPEKCFNSKKDKYLTLVTSALLAIIVGLGWMQFTNKYFDVYYVNTALQKEHILSNPITYLFVIIRTYFEQIWTILSNVFAGNNMYHAQLEIYSLISIIYIVIATLSMLIEKKKNKIEIKNRVLIGIVGIIVIALISTAIYIQCTANFIMIDNSVIVGIQGRYFIPVLLLLMMIVGKTKAKIEENHLINIAIFMHLPILFTMLIRFMI